MASKRSRSPVESQPTKKKTIRCNKAGAAKGSKNDEDTGVEQCTSTSLGNDVDVNTTLNLTINNSNSDKCDSCGLLESNVVYYYGHPQNSCEEKIALSSEKLAHSGYGGSIMRRHVVNITWFSVYDLKGHLCPLEMVPHMDNKVQIYMSGYLKSDCSNSSEIDEESIPANDIGPILECLIGRLDDSNKNYITLLTKHAYYNLRTPSEQYKPLMEAHYEKMWISKVVVEYLQKNYHLQPSYEDLLEFIRHHPIPELNSKEITEELLHKHAHFVCDQVTSLKTIKNEEPLITVPCMRALLKIMDIKFDKSNTHTKIEHKQEDKELLTKVTTTPLVKSTFKSIFIDQLDKTNVKWAFMRESCGVCVACQRPDCGKCKACKSMAKFGGLGFATKICAYRHCRNLVQILDEESDSDQEEYQSKSYEKEDRMGDLFFPVKEATRNMKIKWIGEPVKEDDTNVYYEQVEIDDSRLRNGEFVIVSPAVTTVPSLIMRVVYMWKKKRCYRQGYFHGEVYFRSSDTVLGEVGHPREIFLCDRCCHGVSFTSIQRKACVEKKEIPANWFNLGGKKVELRGPVDDNGQSYFYSKYYSRFTARFEDIPEDPVCPNELRKHRFCPSCERKTRREQKLIPTVIGAVRNPTTTLPINWTEWNAVNWKGYDYKKNSGVFLRTSALKLQSSLKNITANEKKECLKVDEDIYTEHYRKSKNNRRGSNNDTRRPFHVGYIVAITAKGEGLLVEPQYISLKVKIMYRPENTKNKFPQQEDLNIVYWSDDECELPFSKVAGPCHLIYAENVPKHESLHEWLDRDSNRFYFRKAYNKSTGRTVKVPSHATAVGRIDAVKDKGEWGESRKYGQAVSAYAETKLRALRTLDIFAGCGGLSEGLTRAGVADCKWAIESDKAAARAYAFNNKKCTVFTTDCNDVLRDVMDGATHIGNQQLPMRGEVDLLCGGPPCQGFSGMNRFKSSSYSAFQNCLVVTFLSYCDYYRPKYVILENVRTFATHNRGMILKLTMRALLTMGYQCTFGVLQAGHYGVPQTRRRLILLAAAPGYVLPLYPEPTHSFNKRACSLGVKVDKKKFTTNIRWERSAPRRTCTIRDAISDLPSIDNGANCTAIDYDRKAESHFQRAARSADDSAKLRDHICKKMSPLSLARIHHIPTVPGSDWRDLPNISIELHNGTKCKVLEYRHDDNRNGRSPSGALRGVCACASYLPCSQDRQENTLIPWCLPHTGNRHNHWAGLYGRINWDGYFSTIVTDPEPSSNQGRVLHPTQARVVSVRECARSQGFPDTYMFAGTIQNKYRQIGNAVPPPLGAALGREIKKAMIENLYKIH